MPAKRGPTNSRRERVLSCWRMHFLVRFLILKCIHFGLDKRISSLIVLSQIYFQVSGFQERKGGFVI